MAKNTPKATLVDTIYTSIRKDITQHVLLPDQKINIKELSQRYGASETPIKLALNRLISENLIENFPRKGMKVKLIHGEEIEQTFDMRLMLDLYYMKEIITTISYNEQLRLQLQKNVEEHLKIVSDLTPVDAYISNYQYDYEFHELYLKCSGNRKIVDIFHYLNPFLYSNYTFRRQSREKDIGGVKEHETILNAIVAKDETALKEALTTHIYNAKRAIGLILKVDKII